MPANVPHIYNVAKASFQVRALSRARSADEYKLYRAALEYGLIEPIVIENHEDLRSKRVWKELVKPYHHQVSNLVTFCRRLPVTLLADDVGLGKTVSAGLVASELIARGRINKILVVCPKLLMPQWREELETKFSIKGIEETGRKIFDIKFPEGRFALITTYESARMYLDKIAEIGFDMLILDEAHKLRNLYGTEKPPEVAKRFKKAFEDRLFKYVLMLTATPIQNRLWDIYSLVDLLSTARGHENPFGNANAFARKFIEGDTVSARKLKLEKRDEFRSIVYGYMSRFRRADADLDFPERKVELYKVEPSPGEKELFLFIKEEIGKLSPLVRISIAQALVSSPQAFSLQLNNMAENKTVPASFALGVKEIVGRIGITAKLHGLATLIEELRSEKPDHWRAVIFTERRETQSVIEEFLSSEGVACGLINGDSGKRNQEIIGKFRSEPPKIHVIISTRAGSEGVNLQAANVLVNYDLPWNPMIVEQRIGRIQRLASTHSTVCIFNMILRGTFEEYIVGRLLEKLQMATHAVGDVEALLEAAGMGDDESESLQEKIGKLVVASLMGKDTDAATLLQEKNIAAAKIQLERDEETINATLGGMDGANELGPLCPKLPQVEYSLDPHSFVLSAVESLGGDVLEKPSGQTELALDGKNELIGFDQETGITATLYAPGSPAFERLANKVAKIGRHHIDDVDHDPLRRAEAMAVEWVEGFGGDPVPDFHLEDVWRSFNGVALLQVRITVAHDSYERLVEVPCSPEEHNLSIGRPGLEPISDAFQNPAAIGLIPDQLAEQALLDPGVVEFGRFYKERLVQELVAAGESVHRKKKIEDDFTPRVGISLVGLEGTVQRRLRLTISYTLGSKDEYVSAISLLPSRNEVVAAPTMEVCSLTEKTVPSECIEACQISGKRALRHLLIRSEISGRFALFEHSVVCSLTGKHILIDEVEKSDVSGKLAIKGMLKVSALSGKRAESNFFTRCEFSSTEILESESAISQVSGKRYRIDEQLRSVVSGKTGHRKEFIFCAETNQPLLFEEAERCEVTEKIVKPGILQMCEITGKKVMPSELEKSAVTGKIALKKLFVSSSLSTARLLEAEAIRSVAGQFCSPAEAKLCIWSGKRSHPDDLRVCMLTSVRVHFEYVTAVEPPRLDPLVRLLDGIQRNTDMQGAWTEIVARAQMVIGGGRFKIEAALLSPSENYLAVCLEVKTMLGMKTRQFGLLFSLKDKNIVGRIASGKRETDAWKYEVHY